MAGDPRIARYESLLRRLSNGELSNEDGIADLTEGARSRDSDQIDELGAVIVQAVREISERFEFERSLADVSADIVRGLYFDDVMNHVYDSFRTLIPYDRIGCGLLENNRRDVVARWSRNDGHDIKLKAGYSAPLEGSSLQRVIETGRPRIINDLVAYGEEHPESKPTRLVLAEGIRSSLTCPLVAMGRPVGFLFFSSNSPDTYGSTHTEVFLRLATAVSVALDKSLLYEEMIELNTRLRAVQQKLEHQATHDGLTDLLNHTAITEMLEQRLNANTTDSGLAVLMIDVDHFKRVNDQHGHQVGDRVLRQVAEAITRRVRSEDLVGRYGGEEFLVVAGVHSERAALGLAEDLRCSVSAQHIQHREAAISPTVSVGLAFIPPGRVPTATETLAAADKALYAAKHAGRNRVMVAD